MPNYFYRFNTIDGVTLESYCIAYLINGFFGTRKSSDYLNDIIARFILTLPIKERLMFPPSLEHQNHDTPYDLSKFQNLKSKVKDFVPHLNGHLAQDDMKFWEIKLWIEYQIKDAGGQGNMVNFDMLLDHALHFYEWKDKATARSKCRNIWNWYENRDWEYHLLGKSKKTQEEIIMSRQDHIKKVHENRNIKAKNKIKAVLDDMFLQEEIKLKNGKYKIGAIAELTELHRETVSKHLKEMGLI